MLFQLDHNTRILRLREELDREEIEKHTIRVIATNRENGPSNPDPESMLIINIDVFILLFYIIITILSIL